MMRRWSIHKYFIEQRRAISTMERRWSLHAVKMNGSSRSYINELLGQKADEADWLQPGADKKRRQKPRGNRMTSVAKGSLGVLRTRQGECGGWIRETSRVAASLLWVTRAL